MSVIEDGGAASAQVEAILTRYEKDIERLVALVPSNAVLVLDNSEGIALGFLQGLRVADKFVLREPGYLVVSVPDDVVRQLFEVVETPAISRRFFRLVPSACVVIIAHGRTAIAALKTEMGAGVVRS